MKSKRMIKSVLVLGCVVIGSILLYAGGSGLVQAIVRMHGG